MKNNFLYLFLVSLSLLSGCKIGLNGASIPPEMKSVTVNFFENNAPLVVPNLSQQFTEALKSRIRNQTRLTMLQTDGQGMFEGRITGYNISPVAITGNSLPTAANNRLTITVQVKYTDNINPNNSFDQSFSRFVDFPESGGGIQTQEQAMIKSLNEQLTEDIFNRAYANW